MTISEIPSIPLCRYPSRFMTLTETCWHKAAIPLMTLCLCWMTTFPLRKKIHWQNTIMKIYNPARIILYPENTARAGKPAPASRRPAIFCHLRIMFCQMLLIRFCQLQKMTSVFRREEDLSFSTLVTVKSSTFHICFCTGMIAPSI